MKCFITLSFIFLITLTSPLRAEDNNILSTSELIALLDAELPPLMEENNIPGISIAIIKNGETAAIKSYGFANVEKKIKATPTTGYNIGSISKMVTAWGAMHLVEKGLLDIDAPVDQYLTRWHIPASDFDASKVTVRGILTHTSGLSLCCYEGFKDPNDLPTIEKSLSGDTNGSGEVELIYDPGSKTLKSGGAYTLLQLIIEEISGQNFSDYMRENIFHPLGMTNSSFDVTPEMIENSATPYTNFWVFRWETDPLYFRAKAAAGMHSTIEDMAKLSSAVLMGPNGELPGRGVLKPETIKEMTDPKNSPFPKYRNILGYGYSDTNPNLVGKGGGNVGWSGMVSSYLGTGSGFVMLINHSPKNPFNTYVMLCLLSQNIDGISLKEVCNSLIS